MDEALYTGKGALTETENGIVNEYAGWDGAKRLGAKEKLYNPCK